MLDRIRKIVSGPVFAGDEEKTRIAGLLNIILLAALGIEAISSVIAPFTNPDPLLTWMITGTLAAVQVLLLFLVYRGYVRFTAWLLNVVLWGMVAGITLGYSGVSGPGPILFVVIIIIASLLSGALAGLLFGGLSILVVIGVWYAEATGRLTIDPTVITLEAMVSTLIASFFLSALLVSLTTRSLISTLKRARQDERAQVQTNRELQTLRDSLEQQVTVRTRDLERRSAYLEASAEVGRTVTSVLDADQLVQQVVDLIRQRFGLYHVGLFMLDSSGGWAEFCAGSGEIGRLLLQEKSRLEVNHKSMIGVCIANAQTRVTQDVRTEPNRVEHPLLAETRSEAALPLVARGRALGALSALSAQVGTFDQAMLAVLQTIADQVAVALDNARLFAERQTALEAERRAYGEIGREAWASLLRGGLIPGYRYANKELVPISNAPPPEESPARQAMAVPVTVRGQVIAMVDLYRDQEDDQWTDEEMELLETLTEQLGLALDSARLYQDTQRRAAREQLTGAVTARMRESLDMEIVLRTAAQELRQALGVSELNIRLATPEEEVPS